jgi:hypothetical protein
MIAIYLGRNQTGIGGICFVEINPVLGKVLLKDVKPFNFNQRIFNLWTKSKH